MGICLLAPVPAILLRSAMVTCRAQGRVAFGTNAISPFDRIEAEFGPGIPVIIVPTLNSGDPDGFSRRTFGARYFGYVKGNKRTGLHPNPELRPERVFVPKDPDTPAIGYWEVADLALHDRRVEITTLTALGKKTPLPSSYSFQGPLLVTAPSLE